MNANPSSSDDGVDADGGGGRVSSGKKVRKPYTITKFRESWTKEEHNKFLEALQLFEVLNTDTLIYSLCPTPLALIQKNRTIAHVPPPRPKRKAGHPYPHKAQKNVLVPLQPSMAQPSLMDNAFALTPGQISWDEASMLMNTASCEVENFPGAEGRGVARINCDQLSGAGTSSRTFYSSKELEQKNGAPAPQGLKFIASSVVSLTRIFKATC